MAYLLEEECHDHFLTLAKGLPLIKQHLAWPSKAKVLLHVVEFSWTKSHWCYPGPSALVALLPLLALLDISLLVDKLSDPDVCDGSGVVAQQVDVRVDDVHVAAVPERFHWNGQIGGRQKRSTTEDLRLIN